MTFPTYILLSKADRSATLNIKCRNLASVSLHYNTSCSNCLLVAPQQLGPYSTLLGYHHDFKFPNQVGSHSKPLPLFPCHSYLANPRSMHVIHIIKKEGENIIFIGNLFRVFCNRLKFVSSVFRLLLLEE